MRPQIIAEVGINHCGKMSIAKRAIELAKLYGADVAKFQLYQPERLLNKTDYPSFGHWQAIRESELSFKQAKELKDYCDLVGIEFMASAFDFERLGWLEDFGVKRHKIASRSIYDSAYCQAVKNTYKPYLVSTGWVREDNPLGETPRQTWERIGRKEFKAEWLYCVSKYPTKLEELQFHHYLFTTQLSKKWEWYDGFSDHTIGLTAAKVAISLGAKIIEKHFTLNRSLPGPDQAGSIEPLELKELCKFRDGFVEIMGC